MSSSTSAKSQAPPAFPEIIKGSSFLLAYRLKSRSVLLIGGGLIASGRLYYLLEADAHVTLVSRVLDYTLKPPYRIDVSNSADITYLDREYRDDEDEPLDVGKFDMVLTAIDDVELSRKVCEKCRAARTPVNVADVPRNATSTLVRNFGAALQIMVSTSGRGPKIASLVRKRIEEGLPPNVEEAIESVGLLRGELRRRAPGTGGALGQRRMGWMIGICDAWSLEDLCHLTPALRARLLTEGWESDRILTPRDLGLKGWRLGKLGSWIDGFWGRCPVGKGLTTRSGERWVARVEGAVWGVLGVAVVWWDKEWQLGWEGRKCGERACRKGNGRHWGWVVSERTAR